MVERDIIGQVFTEIADIFPFHSTIDDDVNPHRCGCDHEIIKNAAIFAEQQRIAHSAFTKGCDLAGDEGLKRCRRTFAGEHELAHMRYIEQSGACTRPKMFGDDALILNWHMIAGKFDHARRFGAVPSIEG